MSGPHPNEAFLPFGNFEFNDAGDVVRIDLIDDDDSNYEGNNWRKVADTIARSPALKEINLIHYYRCVGSSNTNALAAVFGRDRTHPCMLEEFNANTCILGPENFAVMLPFFKSTPEIKRIDLEGNALGDEGIRLLSEVLSHTLIENLNLCGNQISGEGLGQLFSEENSKYLRKLDLEGNDIRALGLEPICQFLQRDDIEMRELYFNFVDQDHFQTVLESISPQSKLIALFEEKIIGRDRELDEDSTTAMSQMLKNVVCNTDTFEGLCQSNHQLVWVGPHTCHILNSDPMLKKAIMINNQLAHGASIVSRIRSKLRAFYFQGQFDVQRFIDMDIVLMPFILALVTKTERVFSMDNNDEDKFSELAGGKCFTVEVGDLRSVYHLVRNCHLPELFTFPSLRSRIQKYESRISSLEEEVARLTAEVDELRSHFDRPLKKRANK